MPPQEGCVLVDTALLGRLADGQALGEGIGIALPEVALSQARQRRTRQRVTGLAATLAAITGQSTTGSPRSQFRGQAMWADIRLADEIAGK